MLKCVRYFWGKLYVPITQPSTLIRSVLFCNFISVDTVGIKKFVEPNFSVIQ